MKSLSYKRSVTDLARDDVRRTLRVHRHGERGYTLVGLLALMTIMAIALMAVTPSIHHQVQREKELEAIARGEEVADAIAAYYRSRNQLPTSIDQLLEGVPVGTKKLQILRPAAARDPLSSSGEWLLIKPRSPELTKFQTQVMRYAGNRLPPLREQWMQPFVAQITGIANIDTNDKAPGGEITSTSGSTPFIGVTSRSTRDSIVEYYGIDRHDQWVFTPLFR